MTSDDKKTGTGHSPKVVIVGAGMAGLAAARELRRLGWPRDDVLVLEAAERIGGRMRTCRHPSGFLYDVGAAYIHGVNGNPVAALAQESGISLKEVSSSNPWMETSSNVAVFLDSRRLAGHEEREATKAFNNFMARVREKATLCSDPSVSVKGVMDEVLLQEPYIHLTDTSKAWIRLRMAAIALWHGSDLEDVQLLEFGIGGGYGDFPGPHCIIEGGMARLIDAIATPEVRECIRTQARVDKIALCESEAATPVQEGDGELSERRGVSVLLDEASMPEIVEADAVIVTVPLPLFQQGQPGIHPPFPEEMQASLGRLRIGAYEKIIVEYREAFWPADVPFIGCLPPTPPPRPTRLRETGHPSFSEEKPRSASCDIEAPPILAENFLWSKGIPVISVAIIGEEARRAVGNGIPGKSCTGGQQHYEEESSARAMAAYRHFVLPALENSFGGNGRVIPLPLSVTMTRWWAEELQRGSYSYFGLRERDSDIDFVNATVRESSSGRIFMAGEASSVEYQGSVHGAFLSGVRAAHDVAEDFRNPGSR